MLYLTDCCTALHNCSNARVRYKITCWYFNRKKQGVKLIFKPNSINCFVLAHNPASVLQIRNATYQNVPQSLNYTLQYFVSQNKLSKKNSPIIDSQNATICNFLMHVSSDHVSHHAPAIERSQSDRISNFFVCLPFFLLEYQQVILYRTLAFEQRCSAVQQSMRYNTQPWSSAANNTQR